MFNIYDDLIHPPDPTGVNDSSIAINYAAQQASGNGGGIVFVPPGNYKIQFTISLPSNVHLVGSDQGDSVITAFAELKVSQSNPVLTNIMVTNSTNVLPSTPTPQSNIGVSDITFNGDAAGQSGSEGYDGALIEFKDVVDVTIQRCVIQSARNHAITVDATIETATQIAGNIRILDNTIDVLATIGSPDTGDISIRVTGYKNVIIRSNVIGYNPPMGWTTTWSNDGIDVFNSSDVTISGNQITFVNDGINCDYGSNCVISDNIVENFLGYGIRSERTALAGTAVSNLVIADNVVNASTSAPSASLTGIEASAGLASSGTSSPTSSHYAIGNNTVKGPFSASGAGIICAAPEGACSGNAVDLNTTSNVVQVGILVQSSSLTVTGNEVFDDGPYTTSTPLSTAINCLLDAANSATTIGNVAIAGNGVTNAVVGIEIGSNLMDVSITNNNLAGSTTPIQIAVGKTLVGCRIAGNLLNPSWTPPAVTAPAISVGTSTTANSFPYDCTVSIAENGSGGYLSGVSINGQPIAWPGTTHLPGPIVVQVMVGGLIELFGSLPLSWTWTPQ
jgi:parallel beta-helix repeat protein